MSYKTLVSVTLFLEILDFYCAFYVFLFSQIIELVLGIFSNSVSFVHKCLLNNFWQLPWSSTQGPLPLQHVNEFWPFWWMGKLRLLCGWCLDPPLELRSCSSLITCVAHPIPSCLQMSCISSSVMWAIDRLHRIPHRRNHKAHLVHVVFQSERILSSLRMSSTLKRNFDFHIHFKSNISLLKCPTVWLCLLIGCFLHSKKFFLGDPKGDMILGTGDRGVQYAAAWYYSCHFYPHYKLFSWVA